MTNISNKPECCIVEAWTEMHFKEYFDKNLQSNNSDVVQLASRGYVNGFIFFDPITNATISQEAMKKKLIHLSATNKEIITRAHFNGISIKISLFESAYVEKSEGTYTKIQINSTKDHLAVKKHINAEKESLDLPFYINAMFSLCQDFMIYHFNAEIKTE